MRWLHCFSNEVTCKSKDNPSCRITPSDFTWSTNWILWIDGKRWNAMSTGRKLYYTSASAKRNRPTRPYPTRKFQFLTRPVPPLADQTSGYIRYPCGAQARSGMSSRRTMLNTSGMRARFMAHSPAVLTGLNENRLSMKYMQSLH